MKAMNRLFYHTLSARTGLLPETARKPVNPVKALLLLALFGTAAGVICCENLELPAAVRKLLMQGLNVSAELRTLWDACRNALLPMIILLAACLLCSCFAFGQPLLLVMLFSRGFAAGFAMADCLMQYPFRQGLYACAVLILPYAYASIWLLLTAIQKALVLSGKTARYLFRGQADENISGMRTTFLTWLLVLFLLTAAAAGLHTLLLWLMNDRLLIT